VLPLYSFLLLYVELPVRTAQGEIEGAAAGERNEENSRTVLYVLALSVFTVVQPLLLVFITGITII
jgi:hypothetical protein